MKIVLPFITSLIVFIPLSHATDKTPIKARKILTAKSCSDIAAFLNKENKKHTLVVFDVDGVVVRPKNILQDPECQRNTLGKFKDAATKMDIKRSYEVCKNAIENHPYNYKIVEKGIVNIIKELNQNKIPCIACTGLPIPKLKYDTITKKEIKFGSSFKKRKFLQMAFSNNESGKDVLWGYIVSKDKPASIANFIETYNTDLEKNDKIDNVIMIEDYKKTLQKMKTNLTSELNFTGIHYTYAYDNLTTEEIITAYRSYQN